MRIATIAFAGAVLFSCGLDISPTFAAGKPHAPAAPAIDPLALRAGARMGAYLGSLQAFEVISSAVLEKVIDEGEQKSTSQVSGATAAVTSAALASTVTVLPPDCVTALNDGLTCFECGSG